MASAEARDPLRGVGAVVVLGSIMAVLDVTIANVALNPLAADLHAPLATVQWVSSAYTLALAAVMPASAWAMDRFGTRQVYLTCLGLFAAGSALAACAWSIESLIGFRVLQGLGGGMLMPTGMTMVMRAAGRERLGLATRILGVPLLVAPLLGPVLGGVLVDAVSWRALFAINVPIGILAAVLGARTLPAFTSPGARRLDRVGLVLLSPGLALLILGVTRTADGAVGLPTLGPAIAGVLLIAAFVYRTLGSEHPLIDLSLLRRRSVAAAIGTAALFACGYFGSMFLAPLYFQLARGESVAVSGLLIAPLGLCSAVTTQLASRAIDRVGPGIVVCCGIPTATVGLAAFALQLRPDASYWGLGAALAVMGVGVGCTLMPAVAAANADLSSDEVSSANTTIQVTSQLAAALGTALVAVVLAGALSGRIPGAAGGDGLGAAQALTPAELQRSVGPLVDAFRATYWVGVSLLAASFGPALALGRRRVRRVVSPRIGSPEPS